MIASSPSRILRIDGTTSQEKIRGEFFPFRARSKLRVLCTYVCVPASDLFRFLLSETFATALGLTDRVASRKILYLTNFLIPNLLGFLLNRRPGPMALKRNNIYSFSQSFLLLACVLFTTKSYPATNITN